MGSTKNTWEYDGLGNIIKRKTTVNGTSTAQVTYNYGADSDCGWENLLTNITINNYTDNTTTVETIDYDEIGNPITYRGANLSWYGRQLKSFTKDGTTSTMTYDADGLRSSKTVGTRKTEYQYVGDKLFYEKRGDNQTFYYFYDSYGNLSMIRYTLVGSDNSVSTATYLAQTNTQGDVVALYKKSGELYARYEYDAWGNTLSVTDANGNPITAWYHIANANPIRYRGYYYDSELGLYYLQSRYYDSEIGRFINADGYVTTGQGVMSYNMYSYCQNNPVMFSDPSGEITEAIAPLIVFGLLLLSICLDNYLASKTGELGLLVAENSSDSMISSSAKSASKTSSLMGGIYSLYKMQKAAKEKRMFIEQMSKDVYSLTLDNSYTIPQNKFSVYTQDEYVAICESSVTSINEEFEAISGIPEYHDIGTVEWDSLSKESQEYLYGRFPDMFPRTYEEISRWYAGEGAPIP